MNSVREQVIEYLSAPDIGWTSITKLEYTLKLDYNDIQKCLFSLESDGLVGYDWLPSLYYHGMLVKNWYWIRDKKENNNDG